LPLPRGVALGVLRARSGQPPPGVDRAAPSRAGGRLLAPGERRVSASRRTGGTGGNVSL
jgi:hypothetical protein